MEEEFQTLEEVQAALEAENIEWQKRGLNVANLQLGAIAPLILDWSSRIQAVVNLLILKGIITEDEMNFQYKSIMLNNMRSIREATPDQNAEQIRQHILEGARVRLQNGKLPWEN